MAAPVGAPERLNVRVLAGRSASVAVAVNVRVSSSSTLLLPIAPSDGAMLTSSTVTWIVSKSVPPTPSETTTSNVYVPGPWASVGVQLKSPPEVIDAPVGTAPPDPASRLNVRVLDGRSASVAAAVKASSTSSLTD
jgi:hypothetical protein